MTGNKTLAVPGTPMALGPAWPCTRVTISALSSNAGVVAIGCRPDQYDQWGNRDLGPLATPDASFRGIRLQPGEVHVRHVSSVDDVWIDVATAEDGVSYVADGGTGPTSCGCG